MDEKLLLNEQEAIAFLGGPKRTRFLELMNRGEIESVTIGALRRYTRAGLIAYVERLRQEQGPTASSA